MRAELKKHNQMVAFVWGDHCDVADGLIKVYTFVYTDVANETHCETYIADYARMYWQKLVKMGYHRDTTHIPIGASVPNLFAEQT